MRSLNADLPIKSVNDTLKFQRNVALAVAMILAMACHTSSAQTTPGLEKTQEKPLNLKTRQYSLKIEKLVTTGIDAPWGFEFVDAGRALVTGKNGELKWIVDGKLDPQPISGFPKVFTNDAGERVDLAVDSLYQKNGWIYLMFSQNGKGSNDKKPPALTKVIRGKIAGYKWMEEEIMFQKTDSVFTRGLPSIPIRSMAIVTGNKFPGWKHDLIIASADVEEVRRIRTEGDKVLDEEILMTGYGIVRNIQFGPDGALYILTNTPDALLRITPDKPAQERKRPLKN